MPRPSFPAAIILFLSLGSASAAPVSDWTGAYLGANLGGAWSRSSATSSFTCPDGVGCPYLDPNNWAAFARAGTGSGSSARAIGGLQAGYLWQFNRAVLGLEADISRTGLSMSQTVGGTVPGSPTVHFATTTSLSLDWLFTLRGRLGWAVSPGALVYATAGVAFAKITSSNSFVDDFSVRSSGSASSSPINAGWAVGGGAEWSISSNWSMRAEYMHIDFGSVSTTAYVDFPGHLNATSNLLITQRDVRMDLLRVGLNYRFNH